MPISPFGSVESMVRASSAKLNRIAGPRPELTFYVLSTKLKGPSACMDVFAIRSMGPTDCLSLYLDLVTSV